MMFDWGVLWLCWGFIGLVAVLVHDSHWNRRLECKRHGHQPPIYACKGWWSPGEEYASVRTKEIDGIGRQHAHIKSECPRCGEDFTLCRIHLPRRNTNAGKNDV